MVLASAQETTSVRGRTIDEPEQVTTPTRVLDSAEEGAADDGNDEPALRTPTIMATLTIPAISRTEPHRRSRRRRSRIRASLNSKSIVVSQGFSLVLVLWSRSGTVIMKLV